MITICSNPRCSQELPLHETGFSEEQGCTHYCKICGWGYWVHKVIPTKEEIKAFQKTAPVGTTSSQVEKWLLRKVLRPDPEEIPGKVGWMGSRGSPPKAAEEIKIEHLGGFQPYWLCKRLKKIWKEKYEQLKNEKK